MLGLRLDEQPEARRGRSGFYPRRMDSADDVRPVGLRTKPVR